MLRKICRSRWKTSLENSEGKSEAVETLSDNLPWEAAWRKCRGTVKAKELGKLTQSSLRALLLFGRCHKAQKEKNDQKQQFPCSWHNGRINISIRYIHLCYWATAVKPCCARRWRCSGRSEGVSLSSGALCAVFHSLSCWCLWGRGNSRDCSQRIIPRESPQCHTGDSTGRELLLCSHVMPGIWQFLFENRNVK